MLIYLYKLLQTILLIVTDVDNGEVTNPTEEPQNYFPNKLKCRQHKWSGETGKTNTKENSQRKMSNRILYISCIVKMK